MLARAGSLAFVFALFVGAGQVRADEVDRRLTAYESEVRTLAADLPQPNQLTPAAGQRRLIDAEVAYSLGDYDAAALMLFDLASKPGPDQETATFYLADALFQKGDRGAARGYFQTLVKGNAASRYYQPSLLRLIEIAIAQREESDPDVTEWVGALDRITPGLRLPQVPYVRGKLAHAQGKYDDALAFFNEVAKDAEHQLQAIYYMGTTLVAKKDLARATDVFTDLVERKPRSANDRRVVELSQLALGRLYYERDQPGRSIDSYLLVDRHSDLFPDALYEVAWVYVKGKQYDKALRALELLHLSEPTSQKTPTVRILEGNLRIRKAQMIRNAQITGTMDASKDDPATEYDRAAAVFTETHTAYMPSYQALSRMVEDQLDPAQYLAQIAGRSPKVFQSTAPIPEAAAQYLRDEPEVQRVVGVETDLADVEDNLADTEATIARLEAVIAANDRTAVYPALQSRRSRLGQISDELIKLRSELADQELKLVGESGQLAGLTASRKQLAQQYLALPNAEQAYAARIEGVQAGYDAVEQVAADAAAAIDSTQAVAVALRKYANDSMAEGATPLPADQRALISETLDGAAREAAAIEAELAAVQREVQLGRDLAGVGDDGVAKARQARLQVAAALDAEHRALTAAAAGSRDRGKSARLGATAERAARIGGELIAAEAAIDGVVDRGVAQVKDLIAEERLNAARYKSELEGYSLESRSIGSTVLGASFKDVKAKFYDVIIRTDVGNVDVAWSQKEDNDDDLKRLNLSRQRDLKQLRDEFRDILEGGQPPPSAPRPAPAPPPSGGPAGSPDKGGTDTRIKPGSDSVTPPPAPTVKPDAAKPDAKPAKPGAKPDPKSAQTAPKGGAR